MRWFLSAALVVLMSQSALAGEKVTYSVEGDDYEGYLAKASGESAGLVLVIHDWDGLTDYEVKRAEMLAALGYDAFALDLFGKGNRPTDTAGKRALTGKLRQDRARMLSLIRGGLAEARRQAGGDVVVMGYCFGGGAVLELARSGEARVKGYVTFHGSLATPAGQSYPKDTPPLLIAHGGADTSVKMSHVAALSEELETAGISYEIQVYSGAPHAFTVIGSSRYRETADRRSWVAFSDFLKVNLGG